MADSIPPYKGGEKALFPSSTSTPGKVEVAGKSLPSAPPMRTVGCTTPTSLSSDAVTRINTIIADDIRQLSREDINVKRWLNATLAHVLETAKDGSLTSAAPGGTPSTVPATPASSRKPLQLEEHLVQHLHARVQTHSQELSAGIEDLISSTLVRLPRSTMELTRMATEAAELTEQLQHIQGVIHPTLAAGSEAYVTDLQMRKTSEEKLQKCQRYLETATRMQENIRNLQYLIEHRELMNTKKKTGSEGCISLEKTNGSSSPRTNGANSTDFTFPSSMETTRQRDLDEVAGIVRQTREDLKEITTVDDTFGQQFKTQLEQFEQYIENALEEECVTCLLTHHLERATRLMTTLYNIGRVDAVLMRYGEQAAMHMIIKQEEKLRACVAGGGAGIGKDKRAAAAVAELLRREIIPENNALVSRELLFLSSLVQGTLDESRPVLQPHSDAAGTNGLGQGTATPTLGTLTVASKPSAAPTSTASAPAEGASGSGHVATADDPRAAQALEVISVILHRLYEPVQSTLQPLLTARSDTTSADFAACISIIQLINISASVQATTPDGAEAAGLSTGSTGASPTRVTGKDLLEKLAREVTRRALGLFTGLFHEERVLERYVELVCMPVNRFCEQPLSSILSADRSSSSGDRHDENGLVSVLTQAIQEVLVYAPEKITTQCTTAWHASLSKMFAQLQPTSSTPQHRLLQNLYIYKHRMLPLLVKAQQSVEDWLSTGTMNERYPTSAGLLCADLRTRVWTALKNEIEIAQDSLQVNLLNSITRPILASLTTYTSLHCWGNAVAMDEGGSRPTSVATNTSKPLSTYTQGQVAPSNVVRNIGEMLMELPLTLETLGSSAVAESHRNTQGTGDIGDAVRDTDTAEGVRALIDEYAEEWLETVVCTVVNTFIHQKILPLQIGPFEPVLPSQEQQQAQRGKPNASEAVQRPYTAALEQLTTDLDYVRNILSAVNEESLETVEEVLRAVQALPAASISGAFVVGDVIHTRAAVGSITDGCAEDQGQQQP